MKRLLIAMLCCAAFAGCNKDEPHVMHRHSSSCSHSQPPVKVHQHSSSCNHSTAAHVEKPDTKAKRGLDLVLRSF